MTPPRRRNQAERREATKAALVSAAADIVVQSGVRAVTLARVGERAGYSRGIITHHFGSRAALLEALARRAQVNFVTGLEAVPPGLDRLLHLVEGYLARLRDPEPMTRAFLFLWAEAASGPELRPIMRERDEQFRHDLAANVEAGIVAGAVRADADPVAVAVAVLGQLRGIALQAAVDPVAVAPDALRSQISDQWRHALAVR